MSSKYNILLLNGPNLNMLGMREPTHYGHLSLGMIEAKMHQLAGPQGVELTCFQANSEKKLIGRHRDGAKARLPGAGRRRPGPMHLRVRRQI